MERGAQDYILKNHLDEFRVRRVVRGMIERKTREQVVFLQTQGCGEGQGYFCCHPVIAEKFAEFLKCGLTESAVH